MLRLPHGLVHGTLDLIYQNRKGEWVILDYKTSQVDEKTYEEQGEEYRTQMELYGLAVWQILHRSPREAQIHFLRPGLTHRISFAPPDLEKLLGKYTEMQEQILEFREAISRDISPDKFLSEQKREKARPGR